MTHKIISQALEAKPLVKTRLFLRKALLEEKMHAIVHHNTIIPDYFISVLESFSERNSIISEINGRDVELPCCPRCLKAHAIKSARGMGFGKNLVSVIEEMFDCEIGHNGFYIDEDELLRV